MTIYVKSCKWFACALNYKTDQYKTFRLLTERADIVCSKKSTYITEFDRKSKRRLQPARPHTIHRASMCIVLLDKLSVVFTLSRCGSEHFTRTRMCRLQLCLTLNKCLIYIFIYILSIYIKILFTN